MTENIDKSLEEMEAEKEAKEKAARLARLKELEDIRKVIETDAGVRMFRRMIALGGVFTTSFRRDDQAIEFREGHRNLALIFLGDISAVAPDKMALLLSPEKAGE